MAENIPLRRRRMTSPTNEAEPPVVTTAPPPRPPSGLSREARQLWRRVVETWVMDPAGEALLRGACEAWDRYQAARQELAAAGQLTVTLASGAVRAHPAAKLADDAFHSFRMTIKQLGLELEDVHA